MIEYYKDVDNGYILSIATGSGTEKISKAEYDSLANTIKNRPIPPSGYDYMLRADTLEWELAALPPMPEPEDELTDEEALAIILGGGEA